MLRFLFCFPFFKCGSHTEDHRQLAIRKYILRNVKKGRSIEEVDEKIRQKFGQDAIVYQELDYWYYQFYNGKRSMNDERRFHLQLVSTRPGCLANLHFEYLTVDIKKSTMTFSFNPHPKDYEEIAVPLNMGYSQLKLQLGRSELKFKNLSIYTTHSSIADGTTLRNMEKLLSALDHQLHVEKFYSAGYLSNLLSLLPYLKPGVLQGVTVIEFEEPQPFSETVQELIKLEQWNKLKILSINFQWRNPLIFYPLQYFMQFEVIMLFDPIKTIDESPELFIWIRQLVKTSPNIDLINARLEIPFRDACSTLDPEIEIEWDEGHDGIAYWRIPGSTFIVGRNPDFISQLLIVKENSIHWFGENGGGVIAQ
ncbi:hypothetical protein CAEBREN_08683 [Caenorhabditis brenneri]|uniref:DUF38 domain-containing protein n=1 Tax=Caenorhabditis brenneri TaxID=135651 RepID=G0P052_CAEBE|nr:hypothetical protein CAEBREN_08683 [Caenorhabditis brenneri]